MTDRPAPRTRRARDPRHLQARGVSGLIFGPGAGSKPARATSVGHAATRIVAELTNAPEGLIPARINPDLKPREATPATEAA